MKKLGSRSLRLNLKIKPRKVVGRKMKPKEILIPRAPARKKVQKSR